MEIGKHYKWGFGVLVFSNKAVTSSPLLGVLGVLGAETLS